MNRPLQASPFIYFETIVVYVSPFVKQKMMNKSHYSSCAENPSFIIAIIISANCASNWVPLPFSSSR